MQAQSGEALQVDHRVLRHSLLLEVFVELNCHAAHGALNRLRVGLRLDRDLVNVVDGQRPVLDLPEEALDELLRGVELGCNGELVPAPELRRQALVDVLWQWFVEGSPDAALDSELVLLVDGVPLSRPGNDKAGHLLAS